MHTSSRTLLLVLAALVVAGGVSITFWVFGNPLAIDRTGTAGDPTERGWVTPPDWSEQVYQDYLDCRIPSDAGQLDEADRTGFVFLYAQECDADTVRKLIASGNVDFTARGENGWTLLHVAARNRRHPGVINLFLYKDMPIEARADITVASRGYTPLGVAISAKNVEATRELLNAGADPTAAFERWNSLIAYCRERTESENENFNDQPACEVLYEWLEE